MDSQTKPRFRFSGEAVIALCVLGLAAFLVVGDRSIGANHTFGLVGPQAFPIVVALLLGVVGLVLLADALTGKWQNEEIGGHQIRPLMFIGGGLLAEILFIQPLGFVIASSILFLCVARAFGSRRPLRDVTAALGLTIVTYLLFTRLLLLNLPAGWLWDSIF